MTFFRTFLGRENHLVYFLSITFYINNLASALNGCQFVYTGEEAYRQEAVCVYWVSGAVFWRGFLSVRCLSSGELLMSADRVSHGIRRKGRFRCYILTQSHTRKQMYKNTHTDMHLSMLRTLYVPHLW